MSKLRARVVPISIPTRPFRVPRLVVKYMKHNTTELHCRNVGYPDLRSVMGDR